MRPPRCRRPYPWAVTALALVLVVALVASLTLTSCRKAQPTPDGSTPGTPPGGATPPGVGGTAPPGPEGTTPAPPGSSGITPGPAVTPARLSPLRAGEAVVVGPFSNLRTFGWIDERRVWAWGDVSDTEQVFFSLGLDGTARGITIPRPSWPSSPLLLPGEAGFVGIHYPEPTEAQRDMTAWYVPAEGQTLCLGRGDGLKLSPSGEWLLHFGPQGTVVRDTHTWAATVVPAIPSEGFPYSGCNTGWVDDTLAVVRRSLEPDPGQGLQLVRLPLSAVVTEIATAGQYLSPFLSPGGAWLAVLGIDADTATWSEEGVHPRDLGQEIRVYPRAALSSPSPVPVALLVPGNGLATSLVWSADGTRLAFATVRVAPPGGPGPGVSYEDSSGVIIATAPSFETQDLPLGLDGAWLPLSFSPGGRYLALQSANAADDPSPAVLLWDFGAGRAVTVSPDVEPWFLEWAGDDLLCGTATDATTGNLRAVMVEAATGQTRELAWLGQRYSASGGGHLALCAMVQAGERLGPLGPVAAGDWLVLCPVAAP